MLADHFRGETTSVTLQNFQSSFAARLEDLVGLEGVEFAGAKAVDGFAYMADELGRSSLVAAAHTERR